MIKSFTFVRRQAGLSREQFFERWCAHTKAWDLKDHPDCTLNRLVLTSEEGGYDGLAEVHWPDEAALAEAVAFYGTEAGKAHWADLQSFMDIDNSPTVSVVMEAEISIAGGIEMLIGGASSR